MVGLFEEYKNAGKISEALLIGQNMLNREPGNADVFEAYFSYLCTLAETLPSISDRRKFADQANLTLAFYSENASLTGELVEVIFEYQERINTLIAQIEGDEADRAKTEQNKILSKNAECIKNLYKQKEQLIRLTTQEVFDSVIAEIRRLDAEIDSESLTDEQNKTYESLTKELTELISQKMRQIEHIKDVTYNKSAAEAYNEAFRKFRDDETRYKNQTQLFALASTTLFAYDASRLFNETLIYYNHVYSYIFSKLDDSGKFALTRFSIECEKKQR